MPLSSDDEIRVASRTETANIEFALPTSSPEGMHATKKPQYATIAELMDIRDELRLLNKTLPEASIYVNGKVG